MRLKYFLPLVLFAAVSAALYIGLSLDPSQVLPPMVGKEVPQFDLPPVEGTSARLTSDDLKQGEVTLVNIFASWCAPCHIEHPFLMELKEKYGLKIYGIDYKDEPNDIRNFLDARGDPYAKVGADIEGRVAIDWGASKYPENYIIDGDGKVLDVIDGPITSREITERILPILKRQGKRDSPL
jgi:cytochrome c biogenesis protein CcmG/thiol:disulfide interchange protein DsbE